MNKIGWSDVEAVAANLASTPTAMRTIVLAMANGYFDTETFSDPDTLKMIRSLFAAHLATLFTSEGSSASSGLSGALKREKAGALELEYDVSAAAQLATGPALSTTHYGRLVQFFTRTHAGGPRLI